MPEIIPFGKYKNSSVEQVVIRDYKYFTWLLQKAQKPSLKDRLEFVEHVANNFVSQVPCGIDDCEEPARLVSVYNNYHMNYRGSSRGFVYCSRDCFENDSYVTGEMHKVSLERLALRTAISSTKTDTNNLVKLILHCMGMKEGRKTKEYLEQFFDDCPTI
jgi:hypothetical protein